MLHAVHAVTKCFPRCTESRPCRCAQLLNFHLCAGHPHIVQLLEVYATPTDLAIVMEFANGGAYPRPRKLTLTIVPITRARFAAPERHVSRSRTFGNPRVCGTTFPCQRAFRAFCYQRILHSGTTATSATHMHAVKAARLRDGGALLASLLPACLQGRTLMQNVADAALQQAVPATLQTAFSPCEMFICLDGSAAAVWLTHGAVHLIRSCLGRCTGDLSQIVDNMAHTRLPEAVVRRLFQQLVVAIDYCHRLGIANRDIKARLRPLLLMIPARVSKTQIRTLLQRRRL